MNLEESIFKYFGDLEDPRSDINLTHPLINVVNENWKHLTARFP